MAGRLTKKLEEGFYVAEHAHNTDEVTHKLGKFEDIFELIEEMYKKPVCWKLDNGDIVSEDYSYEDIYYDFRKNEIVIYGYGFLAGYKVEEYGKTWWFEEVLE